MKKDVSPIVMDAFWRYLTNFWSFVCFGAIIYDFIYDHALGDILPAILVTYVALLTLFVGAKEFQRWYETHESRHPGELFVIAWTVLIIGIFAGKIILHKNYQVPGEVLSTYIAVLSILAITQKSKTLRAKRRKRS